MTKKQLILLKKVLEKIKNPDTYVTECLHNVDRNLLIYERCKGQLREMSDYEY